MDAFSYLSVLLSIILGLAITQVLQGVRGLLLARERVVAHWPTFLWAALILVMAMQSWWASFGLVRHHGWTFAAFGMVLVQTTLLYMLAALVLPDMPADAPVDLPAHYARERRPFFAIFLAILAASILKDYVIDGHVPQRENLLFHAALALLAIIGFVAAGRRAALAVALGGCGLVALYIAALFTHLG